MRKTCINCREELPAKETFITNGMCKVCIGAFIDHPGEIRRTFLDSFETPLLLMQPEPRTVTTANKNACALFGKDLSRVEGLRGGQVFDCEYAFTEAGCGLDEHCQECKIRNAIVETFKTGQSFTGISTVLTIKSNDEFKPYSVTITTESVGKLALVRIDQFQKIL